ncbi:portal protein [Acinetobacter dispersus]|uniref:portal protein n=1 Tax=Acinetobacter dispersus TaxID=70348 RepID=UPI001F4A6BB3|nr:portal protein [Acinetobacter dispersus]MCH7392430.1 portal protein [Acinetobacter dispersus]
MNEDAIKKLKKRFDKIWQMRVNDLDDYCAEIALHVLPVAIKTIKNQEKHERATWRKIVDNTGKDALKVLAAGMLSGTCSPSRPWFVIEASDPELKKDLTVKQWLKELQDICYSTFAKSNVYRTIHNCYLQEGAFGTCAALAPRSKDAQIMDLIPMSFGEYAITVDAFNKPNGVYRKFKLTVENLVAEFGIDVVSDQVKTAFENDNIEQEFVIHHAVYQRVGAKGFGAKNMKYASVYYEANTQDKLLRESGLESFEVICGRWTVSSSDVYGESPATDCFGDMRALQKAHLQFAKGIDYQVSPPLLLPSHLKGQEKETLPNGIAFYNPSPTGNVAQVQPMMNVQFAFDGVFTAIAQCQDRINRAFFKDLFLMLDQYDQGKMTATEVYERKSEKMLMLGPVVERQIDELLRPLVEICVQRVLETVPYLMETAPQAIQGADIKIEFVSILALAQRATGASNLQQMLAMIGQMAQFNPEALDKFDTDNFIDEFAEVIGATPRIFRDKRVVDQIRNDRAKQQQAQAQQLALQQQSAINKDQAQALRTVSEVDPDNMANAALDGGIVNV